MAAPYRLPVWRDLAMRHRLNVGLLESNRSLAADAAANRGRDWLHDDEESFRFLELPSWKYARGEARYYTIRALWPFLAVLVSDVVVFGGWESPAYWQALAVALLSGARRVGFYESPIATMRHRTGPIARARATFFRLMHVVVVPGPAARESLLQMGVSPSKIVQGFNAVDVRAFHDAAQDVEQLPEPSNGSVGHRFVVAGQLIPRKRVGAVLDAYSAIAEEGDELTIIGKGSLEKELRFRASACAQSVSFVPYVENAQMPAALARNHTLVLASSEEVWGLVVNEALAAGLHVVVTENCGVVPSVRGMQGVFVAKADGSDLADKLEESRNAWSGRILEPEILRYTPEAFAWSFDEAIELAARKSAGRQMDVASATWQPRRQAA